MCVKSIVFQHFNKVAGDKALHFWVQVTAQALRSDAMDALPALLESTEPEVRAAAVFALGACVQTQYGGQQAGAVEEGADIMRRMPPAERAQAECHLIRRLISVVDDACPLVRAEVAVAFGRIASGHAEMFQVSRNAACIYYLVSEFHIYTGNCTLFMLSSES